MIEPSLTIDDVSSRHGEPHALDGHAESLEQRVHRLEDAVAALQDTHFMEERVAERVLGKVSHSKELDGSGLVEAERRTAPAAAPVHQAHQPAATPMPAVAAPLAAPKSLWVIIEVVRDIRGVVAMFFDPRYRVSWSAYFSILLLFYVLVSHWLWAIWAGIPLLGLVSIPLSTPFIGQILDKAFGLVFALLAFKCLAREQVRYRESLGPRPPRYSPY